MSDVDATPRRVRVAVLDSGIASRHPHITRSAAGGITLLPQGDRPGFEDALGHGTAVCAVLQAMAPEADLFAVKIFDTRLATSLAIVLRALDWCIDQRMDVINLSLGTTNEEHRPHFTAAVERVAATGAILVSAAELNGTAMLPGSLPGVLGVVEDAACSRERCRVDLAAARLAACPFPLDIAGVPRERNLRGVSFAVAHVSAEIARLWQAPLTAAAWRERLAAQD